MDKNIKGFKTERESVYTHLPDGRVQRFKTIEGKVDEPSDSIVFIPNYNLICEKYSQRPEVIGYVNQNMGSNEKEFLNFLSSAIYRHGFEVDNVHISDENYNILRNNEQINNSGGLYLAFIKKQGDNLFLPVNKNPVIGNYPLERSHYNSSKGEMKDIHLGNKVIDITKN